MTCVASRERHSSYCALASSPAKQRRGGSVDAVRFRNSTWATASLLPSRYRKTSRTHCAALYCQISAGPSRRTKFAGPSSAATRIPLSFSNCRGSSFTGMAFGDADASCGPADCSGGGNGFRWAGVKRRRQWRSCDDRGRLLGWIRGFRGGRAACRKYQDNRGYRPTGRPVSSGRVHSRLRAVFFR